MRASDLLRDLLEPGCPAKPANPANSRASTAFAGLRMAANGCESGADGLGHSQISQPFATAKSKQPCGLSQDSQVSQPDPSAPCQTCGCGSLWRGESGTWHCESCDPPGAEPVRTWRNVGGGKLPSAPRPTMAWPADLDALLRRVATAFEWTQADVRDFRQWARRSPEGLADARAFLQTEAAKLPVPGLDARRREVLARLAADPALRVAWTCADDGGDPVRLVVAIRDAGCCELAIPRAKFEALALPQLIGSLAEGAP